MRKILLAALAVVALAPALLLLSCSSRPVTQPPPSVQPLPAESLARQMYLLTSKENPRLAWNECLARTAAVRANYLVSINSFSHRDAATGKNPVYDKIRECVDFRVAGENLTRGSDDPKELYRALMDSPSHRGNIMDPGFEMVGIGCCGDCCVQLFVGF
ncbi:MAG: CAP domain-containing protein [Desulfobacteraceae bacterium]|nr:CAP domain-containing protein [Desulfobacteraceae bacterium]